MTEKTLKESFKILQIEDIIPSRTNPRKEFNQVKLNELAESIKSNGVIQPVIVRKNGEPKDKYELVLGERRYRASKLAGLDEIPAIIKVLTDEQCWEMQIIENLQRVDIHPLHEAEGFKRVIDSGKYTKELLAAKVGKSKSYISQRMKLNDLIVEAKNKFYDGKLMLGHALVIAKLQDKDQKDVLSWKLDGFSVDTLESSVRQKFLSKIADAPFDAEDQSLAPEMGKCSTCHMRSGFDPNLFPELKEDDYCTFRKCFDEKVSAHIDQIIEKRRKKKKEIIKISRFYHHPKIENGVYFNNSYELIDDENELQEGWKTVDAIWIDGQEKGFTTYVQIKVQEEPEAEDNDENDEEEREDGAENQLSENNREIHDKRLKKVADHLVIGVLKKFDEVREFTLEVMKKVGISLCWDSDYDTEETIAFSLKLVNDEEELEKFDLESFIEECDDPKLVKDIIMQFVLLNLASNPYHKDFNILKKIAVEEYGIDLPAIEKQVEEEFPFEEESKK